MNSINQVLLSESATHAQDYLDIDVTRLITDMIQDPSDGDSLMMVLRKEIAYARMMFASVDHADSSKHPTLFVDYDIP